MCELTELLVELVHAAQPSISDAAWLSLFLKFPMSQNSEYLCIYIQKVGNDTIIIIII